MDCQELIPPDLHMYYEIHEWRNPCAVLSVAYPSEWADILEALRAFRLLRRDIGEKGVKGGGKSKVAIRLDRMLRARGWNEKSFDTRIVVAERDRRTEIDSPTHKVDCFKGKVALELEWNNKTEFYDRDLNNFRLLFDLRIADVGIIITRCDELQQVLDGLGRGGSYGPTTTVLSKLKRKLDGGAGGGCPVLAIGMRRSLYVDDIADPKLSAHFDEIERGRRTRERSTP
jgi:hypothetical protein